MCFDYVTNTNCSPSAILLTYCVVRRNYTGVQDSQVFLILRKVCCKILIEQSKVHRVIDFFFQQK